MSIQNHWYKVVHNQDSRYLDKGLKWKGCDYCYGLDLAELLDAGAKEFPGVPQEKYHLYFPDEYVLVMNVEK